MGSCVTKESTDETGQQPPPSGHASAPAPNESKPVPANESDLDCYKLLLLGSGESGELGWGVLLRSVCVCGRCVCVGEPFAPRRFSGFIPAEINGTKDCYSRCYLANARKNLEVDSGLKPSEKKKFDDLMNWFAKKIADNQPERKK